MNPVYKRTLCSLLTVSIAFFLLSTGGGCTPAPGDDSSRTELQQYLRGEIKVDGSSTVYPISEAVIAQFSKEYLRINIPLGQSGTGPGFKRFIRGEIEIADASRPIKLEEVEALREAGIAFIEVPVAYDGLTIVVPKENDWVDHLTVDELRQIFTVAGGAQKWSDLRPEWPDHTIAVFAPGTASGTFDYFKEVVAGKDGQLRNDMSTSEDDNVLVTGVSGSAHAIGFFGVAYFEENQDKLKAIPIINPDTGIAVPPNSQTIESGDYAPFSRPLFIYVDAKSIGRPDLKRFIEFYLDRVPQLARTTGYVPLPRAVYDLARKNITQRNAGTHYLTPEGEKITGPVTEIYQEKNRWDF